MFSKMRIGPRLVILIALQAVLLVAIGATGLTGLNQANTTTERLTNNVSRVLQLENMIHVLEGDLLGVANGVNSGATTWAQGREVLTRVRAEFGLAWKTYVSILPSVELEIMDDTLGTVRSDVDEAIAELESIFDRENRTWLELFVINDIGPLVNPFLQGLAINTRDQEQISRETLSASATESQHFITLNGVIVAVGLIMGSLLGVVLYRSIVRPIRKIANTVHKVAQGDITVRTRLRGTDEIGELSHAFDDLLEDKVKTLSEAEDENEKLNDSVIGLLEAVSKLSDKDLTIKVPVTEDVTGPVADAVNQMASETAEVLKEVNRIAGDVEVASGQVDQQAVRVNEVAVSQQTEADRTARELASTAARLNEIAKIADQCNQVAEKATSSTRVAVETVNGTLGGMTAIREIIQETAKRIKHLSERSQEISGIVDIINNIAERTTVLALNASMQAAAAGEAGRGFAVVADEVQRLAENSQNATGQIATLVKNIQVETNDTMSTMDHAITRVVEGSKLAEEAGGQMVETQETTSQLVESVRKIAESSKLQVRIGRVLLERGKKIQISTRETGRQLNDQLEHTRNLAEYAKQLHASVRVFRLPA